MIRLLDIAGKAHQNILLLQGPVGPFFRYLAHDLRNAGANVFKINFNGGDALFYPFGCVNYKGSPSQWPEFLRDFIKEKSIDLILLFGDCRPLHQRAHAVAEQCKIEIGVFEEGYIRPDYVTLEQFGVNGNSKLKVKAREWDEIQQSKTPKAVKVPMPFRHAMVWAMLYNSAGTLMRPYFRNYSHHRDMHIFDGILWLKSFWRKWGYKMQERCQLRKLTTELSKRFFLVPLQVGNDAQIHAHSHLRSNRDFIKKTLKSFASHAPKDTLLVIKQHPLERGYSQHGPFIEKWASALGLQDRVIYIHDQHLPTLLNHALGVVVINSTVGLSALHHQCPLFTLGNAIYGMKGLTFQGELDDFWRNSKKPDMLLYKKFISHLKRKTQINGSFYRRLPQSPFYSGLMWDRS